MNQSQLMIRIAEHLPSVPASHPLPIGGGCIHHAWQWGPYFIKTNKRTYSAHFQSEATSLNAIRSTGTIRVPEVIKSGTCNEFAFLIMENLNLCPSGNESLLGEQLAELHTLTAESFGFSKDNFIGGTPQPNPWIQDWRSFYRDSRLGHMLKLLAGKGVFFPAAERLLDRIPNLLPENPEPSFLHGDLWGGNKAYLPDGTPVIYDPASYFGHAACDLAMTRLFGGFRAKFYDAYRSSSDRDDPSLDEIYNLYHILNHALLFGGTYVDQAASIIRRFE